MDNHTPEQRHNNMAAIRNKDTSIEIMLRKEIWSRGLRYRKNYSGVCGHPDVAFTKYKIAVFCDSEFWHGYDWENRKTKIQTNREFWISKIERNMQRDREVEVQLRAEGWTVIRFWGKEIKRSPSECVEVICRFIEKCRSNPI